MTAGVSRAGKDAKIRAKNSSILEVPKLGWRERGGPRSGSSARAQVVDAGARPPGLWSQLCLLHSDLAVSSGKGGCNRTHR